MRGGDARLTGLDIPEWIVDVIDLDLCLVFIRAREGNVSDHGRGDTG